MPKAAYDPIAKDYKESKQLPFRRFIEAHMIFSMMGDLDGRSVLDLACGDGIYSRKLKSVGAERVTGLDISPEMNKLAEAEESQNPRGGSAIFSGILWR